MQICSQDFPFQRLSAALATSKLKHVIPRVESVLWTLTAASQIAAVIMDSANHAPTMVKLATSAFAAVSSTTLALTGSNAVKKPILVAIASLNAQEMWVTSVWKI